MSKEEIDKLRFRKIVWNLISREDETLVKESEELLKRIIDKCLEIPVITADLMEDEGINLLTFVQIILEISDKINWENIKNNRKLKDIHRELKTQGLNGLVDKYFKYSKAGKGDGGMGDGDGRMEKGDGSG